MLMMTAADPEMLLPIFQTTVLVMEDCTLEKNVFQVCKQSKFGVVECINVLGCLVRCYNAVDGSTVISYNCIRSLHHKPSDAFSMREWLNGPRCIYLHFAQFSAFSSLVVPNHYSVHLDVIH
jgi:hypothetical protein